MSKMKKSKIFHMPHAYAFTVILILVCGALTHIIPAGVYDLVEMNGRLVVDPETFHYLEEQTPLSLWDMVLCVPRGLQQQYKLVFMVFMFGGDALAALCLVPMANLTSYATGAFSMSITGVAQDICQLPIYSAAGFRLICMMIFIAVNSVWVIHYIKTIRKDPAKSLLYGGDDGVENNSEELPELTVRRKLAVAIFVIGVIVLVYGSTHGWDSYTELPMVMVAAGVSYEIWMKFYAKYFLIQVVAALAMIAAANLVGLGPF